MAKNTGKTGASPSSRGKKPKKKQEDGAPAADAHTSDGQPRSNQLTEDQQRALFFNHVNLYEKELAAKKAQDKKFRDACKLIKSEGTSIDDVKLAISLQDPEGEAAEKAKVENNLRIAKWLNVDYGHQFTFLEAPESADKAREEGKIAGLKGVPKKPPHDPSVPQYKAWMEGYDEGQQVMAQKFQPPKPQTPPSPPTGGNVIPGPGSAAKH